LCSPRDSRTPSRRGWGPQAVPAHLTGEACLTDTWTRRAGDPRRPAERRTRRTRPPQRLKLLHPEAVAEEHRWSLFPGVKDVGDERLRGAFAHHPEPASGLAPSASEACCESSEGGPRQGRGLIWLRLRADRPRGPTRHEGQRPSRPPEPPGGPESAAPAAVEWRAGRSASFSHSALGKAP